MLFQPGNLFSQDAFKTEPGNHQSEAKPNLLIFPDAASFQTSGPL